MVCQGARLLQTWYGHLVACDWLNFSFCDWLRLSEFLIDILLEYSFRLQCVHMLIFLFTMKEFKVQKQLQKHKRKPPPFLLILDICNYIFLIVLLTYSFLKFYFSPKLPHTLFPIRFSSHCYNNMVLHKESKFHQSFVLRVPWHSWYRQCQRVRHFKCPMKLCHKMASK